MNEVRKKPEKDRDILYLCECAELAGYKGQKRTRRGKEKLTHPLENVVKRLMKNPRVLAAIEGFKMEELVDKEFGEDQIKKKLIRVANANMLDFAEWTEYGVRFIPSSKLERAQGECIIKVSQTITKNGGSISIERLNPLDALDKLIRMHGLYKDTLKFEDPLEKELDDLTDDELKQGLAILLARRPELAESIRRASDSLAGQGRSEAEKV